MGKPKRTLTNAEKAAKRKRRKETMIVFMHGKQVCVPRPQKIEGLDPDEFTRRNADPVWLAQNEMWEYIREEECDWKPRTDTTGSTDSTGLTPDSQDRDLPF